MSYPSPTVYLSQPFVRQTRFDVSGGQKPQLLVQAGISPEFNSRQMNCVIHKFTSA